MTKLLKEKREITNLWLKAFPMLSKCGTNKLYGILGPFVLGIELIKLPYSDDYRPHFLLYPLYGTKFGNQLKKCLDYPVLLFEFNDSKNLSYSIPYVDGVNLTNEAILSVKHYLPFDLASKKISLSDIYKLLDLVIVDKIIPGKEAEIYKIKYLSSIYLSLEHTHKVLREIENKKINWNMERFEFFYGNYEEWINSLKEIDREDFLSIIDQNKKEKKIERLKVFDFIF